ncbi:hypothetical protein ABW636_19550 [Aquimarina sp. 2201CG1-2-11]|uniref:hypothetical protein n=1 Tax=Aquimarina discodermiae TaxID=3231043 RepID=UPI0034618E91
MTCIKNDINDHAYQNFVSHRINGVLETYSSTHKGLDFGAGSGLVITHLLVNNGYDIVAYAPYFRSDKNLLEKKICLYCLLRGYGTFL